MDRLFKRIAFAALGGLALTVLSVLVYAGGSLETDVWGFPSGYFEKEYLPGSNAIHIFPLQALFDFLFWFLLCTAAVGAVSFAWNRGKPVTRDATGGLNHP